MPKFEPKYSEEDFIKVLRNCPLCTLGYISKRVGCARNTADTYLQKMKKDGIITELEIDNGESRVYALTE